MTIPRLLGFAEYWRDTPPVNESVAAIFKSKDEGGSDATTAQPNPQQLLDSMPRRTAPPAWLVEERRRERERERRGS